MRSNYRLLGDYIKRVDVRNKNLQTKNLRGLSMTKEFRETTSNIVGTDLRKYKIIGKNQFACDFMSVIRVHKLPVVLHTSDELIIVSPAYTVFKVKNESLLDPEYLMMWFRRDEFDRYADFRCDSAIRGGFKWDELCEVELPIPSIEVQKEIVNEYQTITKRIQLNEQLNQKLEETAQALYKHWFVDFEFPNEHGEPYKSSGGAMVYNEELDGEIPEGWEISSLLEKVKIYGGGTPKTQVLNYWNGVIPFFTPKDVAQSYFTILTEKYLTEEGLKNCSSRLFPKNTIFVTARGTVGAISIAGVEMAMNQSCYAFKEKNNLQLYGHQFLLKTINELKEEAVGAVFSALVTKDFENKVVVDPDLNSKRLFNEKLEHIYTRILNKFKENNILDQTQNLLLSKMATVGSETEIIS